MWYGPNRCVRCVCVCALPCSLAKLSTTEWKQNSKVFFFTLKPPVSPNPLKLTLWISKQLHAFNAITLLHFFVCHCNSFIPHSWAAVVELKSVSFAVLHLISQYFARCTRTHEQTEEKRSYGDDKPKTCIPSPVRNHRACVVLLVSPHVNRTPTRLTETVFALSKSTRACSSFSYRQQQHQHFDSILIPFAHHFLMASFFNSEPFFYTSFSSLFRGIDVSWKRFQRYTFRSICCVCVPWQFRSFTAQSQIARDKSMCTYKYVNGDLYFKLKYFGLRNNRSMCFLPVTLHPSLSENGETIDGGVVYVRKLPFFPVSSHNRSNFTVITEIVLALWRSP